ncbi:MAG TPA: TraR/DksA C4-type zinc finger protein [Acidimicrobiia bacterium]|nr:TraR/DksA C4-type zinc finger protein [Acidimicrobiia bacterium]
MSTSVVPSPADADALRRSRSALLTELATQRQVLADCDAALEELDAIGDRDAIDTRESVRLAQARALGAVDNIERALIRLRYGTYGRCDECGSTIGAARLEALPATRHCISCASTTLDA